jgi:Leucine-rich repeat (LRR) protein
MNNQITAIDLKSFKNLKYLTIDNNKLKELDLSKNLKLEQITIDNNEISEIDISKNQNLIMHILYIDKNVKIIGTENQMKNYKPGPVVIQN